MVQWAVPLRYDLQATITALHKKYFRPTLPYRVVLIVATHSRDRDFPLLPTPQPGRVHSDHFEQ